MTGGAEPVSVKVVVLIGEQVLLGRNERDEWELLGGRPDPGEDHVAAGRREILEEAGLQVDVDPVAVHVERFEVVPGRHVRIVAHRSAPLPAGSPLTVSHEHAQLELFDLDAALALDDLPAVYRTAIVAAVGRT